MDKLNSDKNGAWEGFRNDWNSEAGKLVSKSALKMENTSENNQVWSIWSKSFIKSISHLESVDGVIALGSVLAITFKDEQGGGYTSRVTETVRESMLDGKVAGTDGEWNIHARILGNVVYLMGSQVMTPEQVKSIQDRLEGILGL